MDINAIWHRVRHKGKSYQIPRGRVPSYLRANQYRNDNYDCNLYINLPGVPPLPPLPLIKIIWLTNCVISMGLNWISIELYRFGFVLPILLQYLLCHFSKLKGGFFLARWQLKHSRTKYETINTGELPRTRNLMQWKYYSLEGLAWGL